MIYLQYVYNIITFLRCYKQTVEEATIRYFLEMRRRYYTTPSSYLELLKLYQKTLHKKKGEILTLKKKIMNGLNVCKPIKIYIFTHLFISLYNHRNCTRLIRW